MLNQTETVQNNSLKEFRAQVQLYCRLAGKTQQDLAAALGLAYPSLNKKLIGQRTLVLAEVKQIIMTLANWQSFETFEQVSTLLHLAGYSEPGLDWLFNPEERQQLLIEAPAPITGRSNLDQRHNLPQLTSSFVGRQTELAALWKLLDQSRQVTLVGTGGCGKTRLAIQAVRQLVGRYQGGIWLVELANLNIEELVQKTVAVTLGVREQAGRSLLENLIHNLKSYGPTLIVLDNCEHLLAGTSALCTELLENCPELRILATSREKMAAPGEVILEIGPLEVPSTTTKAAELKLVELRRFDSIRLFEERARQSLVSFKLERSNATAVRDICISLDGIPLALELAASRLEALSVHQLHTRLNERFRLLARDRDASIATARQQTLRGAIDWSYNLLKPAEQTLFNRLSVFVAGCTLEAAQAVCNAESDLEIGLSEGINSLLQKSLLRQWVGLDGQRRFGMLQTIREYALQKLREREEETNLREQYAGFYARLVEGYAPKLVKGETQLNTLKILDSEYENIREVLYQALRLKKVSLLAGINILTRIDFYWKLRGYYSEGLNYVEQALKLKQVVGKSEYATLLGIAASLNAVISNYEAAHNYVEEALPLCQETNNHRSKGICLQVLGNIAYIEGDYNKSITYSEQAIAAYKEIGDIRAISVCLSNSGNSALNQGDYNKAIRFLEESLPLSRQTGDKQAIAYCLDTLNEVFLFQGNYLKAAQYAQEALILFEEIGDRDRKIFCLLGLSVPNIWCGQLATAEVHLKEALALADELGVKHYSFYCWVALGHLSIWQEEFSRADSYLQEALVQFEILDDKTYKAECKYYLSLLKMRQGDFTEPRQLLKESIALLEEVGAKVRATAAILRLGTVLLSSGEYEQATDYLEQGLALSQESASKTEWVTALDGLAIVAVEQEEFGKAIEYLEQSLTISTTTEDYKTLAETLCTIMRMKIQTQHQRHTAARPEKLMEVAYLAGMVKALVNYEGKILVRPPWLNYYKQGLEIARQELEPSVFQTAFTSGLGQNMENAIDFALTALKKES